MFLGDLIERYRKSLDDIKVKYKPWDVSTSPTTNSTSMVPQNGLPVNSPSLQKDSMAFPTDPKNPVLQKPVTEPQQNLGQKLMTLPETVRRDSQEKNEMIAQGMVQGMGNTPNPGYTGPYYPEASKVALDATSNMVMGSTGEVNSIAGGAAPAVRSMAEEAASKVASKVKGKKGYPSALKSSKGEPIIYHATNEKFDKFDTSRMEGGVAYFTDNAADFKGGNPSGAVGTNIVMKRRLKPGLKLGGYDEAEKFSTDELIQQGYAGLKLEKDGSTWYEIFNPNEDLVTLK